MDDRQTFERRVATEVVRGMGPSEPVDDGAIFSAIATTQSLTWRLGSMFSATRFVIAGIVVALVGGFLFTSALRWGPVDGQGAGVAAPSSAAAVTSGPTDESSEERATLDVDGIVLSIGRGSDQADTWAQPLDLEGAPSLKDGLFISWDTSGSQAAEAMLLWTTFPDSQHARPCLLDPSISSAGELADSVATTPGTVPESVASDLTVGGYAAKQIVVMVAPDAFLEGVTGGGRTRTMGCNPGYFFGWEADDGGAFWQETLPGDTIKVWIVDVDGTLLFIEAATHPEASAAVKQEIDDIIDSIRFE